jgi:hypothetical protein
MTTLNSQRVSQFSIVPDVTTSTVYGVCVFITTVPNTKLCAGTREEPGTLIQGAPVFPGSSRLGIEPKSPRVCESRRVLRTLISLEKRDGSSATRILLLLSTQRAILGRVLGRFPTRCSTA